MTAPLNITIRVQLLLRARSTKMVCMKILFKVCTKSRIHEFYILAFAPKVKNDERLS